MRRRSTLIAICLFGLALLSVISGAVLMPSANDITVPIDRSALEAITKSKQAQSQTQSESHSDSQTRSLSETVVPPAVIVKSLALPIAPDPRLLEHSTTMRLPKIADNGDRPADIYARPIETSREQADLPQIAIVILRAGLSEVMTAEAYLALPPDVSFAISPYASDAERQVRDIRNRGHEVFLEVLSSTGEPTREDRGPLSIDPASDESSNRDRLYRSMSQVTGYAGMIGDLHLSMKQDKGRLLATEAKNRGLHYVAIFRPDSRSTNISHDRIFDFAAGIPRQVLNETEPSDLQVALSSLLSLLRHEDKLILLVEPGPLTIDVIKTWIDASRSRHFRLVPLSALLRSANAI